MAQRESNRCGSNSSNKELLLLENEYRNELPKYSEKPTIKPITKPLELTNRVASFLSTVREQPPNSSEKTPKQRTSDKRHVEMDIYLSQLEEPDIEKFAKLKLKR